MKFCTSGIFWYHEEIITKSVGSAKHRGQNITKSLRYIRPNYFIFLFVLNIDWQTQSCNEFTEVWKIQKKHISKNFFIHDRRRGEEDTICDCNFKNELHVIREFIIHVNIIARFLFLVTSRQLGNPLLTLQCRSGNPALALHAMILRLLYRQNKLQLRTKSTGFSCNWSCFRNDWTGFGESPWKSLLCSG